MRWFSSRSRLRRIVVVSLAGLLAVAVSGCAQPQAAAPAPTISNVVLASTTSTQDSGLFDVLIPAFEKADPQYKVKVIAVGSGEALKLGQTKDADVLLVHSPAAELKFLADGFATARADVMYNDFVIVGPKADPAGVKGSADTTAAMRAIQKAGAAGKAIFVSRGDASGTNAKELTLWNKSGITTPTPTADSWYLSTGQGMGETLKVADEKGAYTLTDRGTWLSMASTLPGTAIVLEKQKALLNQYGVIVIPGAKNEAGGQAFADWILSPAGQKVIAEFGVAKYGQQLFIPNAK
ncbi:MAG TPA: extracellular solute-binding protein [Coriobacteriia bacterium]